MSKYTLLKRSNNKLNICLSAARAIHVLDSEEGIIYIDVQMTREVLDARMGFLRNLERVWFYSQARFHYSGTSLKGHP